LGQSRLAVVYRAEDERLKRSVLVHLLREELLQQTPLRQRFLDEAQYAAQRSHQALLDVYDSGEVAGRPYMVTEDVAGRPLVETLPLRLPEALGVMRSIASAVALAQSNGSPHPPVSSRNIWLLDGGRTVLLENWLLAPSEAALDLAHYRAPERAQGSPPSPATTVYALGILSWEILVGRRPFVGATADLIAAEQLREALPSLLAINPHLFVPGLDRVIMGAAAADAQSRYATPQDFSRALDLYVDQATAQTGRLSILPQPRPTQGTGRFRMLRRGDTAPTVAVQPPPPPPVLRAPAHMPRKKVAPPMMAPGTAAGTPVTDQGLKQTVRRELRRRGCQRAIVKRSMQIVLILALLYAALLGVDYAATRARQLDPGGWIASRLPDLPALGLPDLGWLERLPDLRSLLGRTGASRLVITKPVNLRSTPTIGGELVRTLDEGTVVQRIGEPEPDLQGGPLNWLRVVVVADGTEGWIADQPDRMRAE
jgi:hypothetical protein